MVGIPDGLGAFISGHKQFTLLMNHEITIGAPGIVRAHGSNGAFVSRWTINTETLKVAKGQDHTPAADKVFQWDATASKYVAGTAQWQRLCSADLAAESAYSAHGLGTRDRILLNGEEVADGRAWARVASVPHTGEAWQLPRLGRLAFENAVACPYPQQKTVVALLDDSNLSTSPTPASGSPSEVYLYIGTKTGRGHPCRAGRPDQRLGRRAPPSRSTASRSPRKAISSGLGTPRPDMSARAASGSSTWATFRRSAPQTSSLPR